MSIMKTLDWILRTQRNRQVLRLWLILELEIDLPFALRDYNYIN